VLAGLSLYFSQWTSYYYPKAGFYLLPTRGWELLIGSLVAISAFNGGVSNWVKPHFNGLLSLCGLALILGSVAIFDKHTPFPSIYTLMPTLGTALIIMFATKGTLTNTLLSNAGLVKIGLISYSAYLVHHPVFAFARHHSIGEPKLSLMITLSLVSFVAAYFMWKHIEPPFRSKTNPAQSKKLLILGLTILITFFSFGMAGIATDGFSYRYGKHQLEEYNAASKGNLIWQGCNYGSCTNNITASIVLTGDSHAAGAGPSLSASFSSTLETFEWRTNPGCPTLIGFAAFNGQPDQCSRKNKAISALLNKSNTAEWVILSSHWSLYSSGKGFDNSLGGHETGAMNYYYQDIGNNKRASPEREKDVVNGYIEYVLQLLKSGKKVIVIDQIPGAGWDVPNQYLKLSLAGELTDENFRYPLAAYKNYTSALYKFRALTHKNLHWAEPTKVLCKDKSGCNTSLYPSYFTPTLTT